MERLKAIHRSISIYLLFITVCLLFIPSITYAAVTAEYASDIAPPQITIISPLKDSQIDTGTPRIEVSFFDLLAGIKSDTVHLFIDRMEVTAKAVIEQEDVTGQAVDSPWHISYTPELVLSKGKHEVRFSVQDLAGNRTEIAWSFEVTAGVGRGLSIGGTNTLRVDESPVKMTTDTLALTTLGQYGETGIRLNLTGKITDYPGAEPAYSYDNYNFYYDNYSLGFYRRQSSAVFGYVNSSLDSELLQIGLTMKGGVTEGTQDKSGNQYHWTVFSGDSGSSYGTSADLYQMTGVGGDWRAGSGLLLGGYYVNLDGGKAYNYTGFMGNSFINNIGLIRFEVIRGLDKTAGGSGYGSVLHLDKSLTNFDWGLDYKILEPEYPDVGSSSIFNSGRRGMQSYGIRTNTTINEKQSLSMDGSISLDNLDNKLPDTITRKNITTMYDYHSESGFRFNTGYQGDFQNKEGDSGSENNENNIVIIGIQQSIGVSTLRLNCNYEMARYPEPGDTYDQLRFISSWTQPVGVYNLTPSLLWSDQKYEDGDWFKSTEVRLTWDMKAYPDLPRSTIAFFYRINEELDGGERTRINSYGLLPSVYLRTGPNSTLSLVYNYANWTREDAESKDGADTTVNLTWKTVF